MRTLALGAICLAGFLAACGGDDGPVVTPDANTAIDAPDGVCDPLAAAGMQGCAAGQKCTWITIQDTPESVGKIGCAPDGTVDPAGMCTAGAPGETTGFDNCKAGNVCVGGICKDVCGFGGGANEACGGGQACTRYSDLWANGEDDPMYGACNPTCNPVTQLRGDGTMCPAGNGCYLLVSQTTSTAVCAGAGTIPHGTAITGQAFANSCLPGHQPRRATPLDMSVECGALCQPADVFVTLPADVRFDPAADKASPVPPLDTTKVTNFASEGGAGTFTCASKGASLPGNAAAGESCRYWWAREPFDDLSPFSNTVGWCFKHAVFEYDSDANMATDHKFPRCAALSKGDNVLPIGMPAHDDSQYFWCTALPTMLQTSIKHVKKTLSEGPIQNDRLGGWR